MAHISELVSEPFPLWLCKVGTLGYRYHQHKPYIYGLCNKGVQSPLPPAPVWALWRRHSCPWLSLPGWYSCAHGVGAGRTGHNTTELVVCALLLNLVWFYWKVRIKAKKYWHEKSPGIETLNVWCAWASCAYDSGRSLGRDESNMADEQDERDLNSSRLVEG